MRLELEMRILHENLISQTEYAAPYNNLHAIALELNHVVK